MVDIGAGGGSIARVDEVALLRVGPESAAANPGPVCYGLGGDRPTVTDANLVLDRLDADYFLGGRIALDRAAAETSLALLGGRLGLDAAETAPAGGALATGSLASASRPPAIHR